MHTPASTLTAIELSAYRHWLYATHAVLAAIDADLAKNRNDIDLLDYHILTLAGDHQNGLSASELAEGVISSTQRTGQRVKNLEAKGLVEVRKDPTDGRVRRTHITDQGRQVLADVASTHTRSVRENLIAPFTDMQMRALACTSRLLAKKHSQEQRPLLVGGAEDDPYCCDDCG